MGTRGRETQDMGNTGLTLLPPPEWCIPHRTPSNREGGVGRRSGGLKGHGDRTGQEASRAAPVPGPTAERGARAAMAGPPPRLRPQPPPQPLRLEPYYPPKKKFLGESRGSVGYLGALWKRGHLGALWKRRHS